MPNAIIWHFFCLLGAKLRVRGNTSKNLDELSQQMRDEKKSRNFNMLSDKMGCKPRGRSLPPRAQPKIEVRSNAREYPGSQTSLRILTLETRAFLSPAFAYVSSI